MQGVTPRIVIFVVLGILALAVGLFGLQSIQPKPIPVPITPSQLTPTVSKAEVRKTICSLKKEGLFIQLCQSKFESVDKDDIQKLNELFTLANRIKESKSISAYDRLLLGQLLFASLPAEESLTKNPNDVLGSTTTSVNAQESNDIKMFMEEDLKKIVSSLPKGDNAWVINIMVSKYEWVHGQRQPIYSDQYSEVYDPYPGVSTEPKDESKILYHIASVVGSQSNSQFEGGASQTSEMVAYSFSIMSWNSPPYGKDSVLSLAESGPDPQYLTSRRDFSEDNYAGENLLSNLLAKVKMPSRREPDKGNTQSSPSSCADEYTPGTAIPYAELHCIAGKPGCEVWLDIKDRGLFCLKSQQELDNYNSNDDKLSSVTNYTSPTYPYIEAQRKHDGYLMSLDEFASLENPDAVCAFSEVVSYKNVAICANSLEGVRELKEDLEKGIISLP